jgi:hypothetical protein
MIQSVDCAGGATENSPVLQRGESGQLLPVSPVGAAQNRKCIVKIPRYLGRCRYDAWHIGRDLQKISRFPGTIELWQSFGGTTGLKQRSTPVSPLGSRICGEVEWFEEFTVRRVA